MVDEMTNLLSRAALACVLVAAVVLPASAQSTDRRVRIVRSRGTAAPSFVTGISDRIEGARPARAALTHLEAHPDRYRIAAPDRTLDLLRVDRDGRNRTVRFGQLHRGIPVWGAQYLVHLRERDEGLAVGVVNGDYFTELDVPAQPAFDRDAAEEIARLRSRPLVVDRVVHHGLTVLPQDRGILTYHLTLWGGELGRPARKEVFVNALTGSLALAYDGLMDAGPTTGTGITSHGREVDLEIFENSAGQFEMRDRSRSMWRPDLRKGQITTHDVGDSGSYVGTSGNLVRSGDNHFGGPARRSGAVDAHFGAGKFFEFFKALGRNSVDDNGMSIVSSVNATENGEDLFNAFWDGSQVVYGNPNPRELHPFSADLDVVGHELTHGVVQFTGNLALISQPGAANEAYADYFGEAIDIEDSGIATEDPAAGEIGDDLCRDGVTTSWPCPLRDLNDGKMAEDYGYYLVDFDNGGVHLNATIYGGALWDIREALPDDKADRYIYLALKKYTTPLSDFFDGREAIVLAARELAATPEEVAEIERIFNEHGIIEGWDKTVPPSDAETLVENASPLALTAFTPPAVSGSRFILGDYRHEEDACCKPLQIFVGNVSDPVRLARVGQDRDPETLDDESPDISGRRAVWSHITVERGRLDASVSTRVLGGRVRRIADARGLQWHPSVDGRLIAWEDTRDGDTDIWARRVGRRPRKVIDLRGEQLAPQVSGNWIAWWDVGTGLSGNPRIGMKNFATGRRITIRPPTRFTFMGPPTMGPTHVFWYQDRVPDEDSRVALMKARIGARRATALIGERSRRAPRWLGVSFALIAANRNFVAYTDERAYEAVIARGELEPGDGRDLRLLSVAGGTPVPVTTNRGDQAYPGLGFGRRVVFLDSSQGQTDLVARTVP
jgi:Zn-dependent metalloprotease